MSGILKNRVAAIMCVWGMCALVGAIFLKGHLSLSTFLIYNDMTMFLCELMFE
jgi:hypothetical protein